MIIQTKIANNNDPDVAILVAFRNEINHIDDCVQALLKLNYKGSITIYLGDDNSTDGSSEIALAYAAKHKHIQYKYIYSTIGNAKAKANVLAQLISCCNEEYIFITDADTIVPSTWIQELMIPLKETQIGVVTGVTITKGNTTFEHLQSLDWLLALGTVHMLSNIGIASTAVGNNMAFRKTAYLATGGYENMPFSVTEDFQLMNAIVKKGWKFKSVFNAHVLAYTAAANNWKTLWSQRKRWTKGAKQLPWWLALIIMSQFIYYPVVLVLLFFHIKIAATILSIKLLIQVLFLFSKAKKINYQISFRYILLQELLLYVVSVRYLLYFCVPIDIYWKNRKY